MKLKSEKNTIGFNFNTAQIVGMTAMIDHVFINRDMCKFTSEFYSQIFDILQRKKELSTIIQKLLLHLKYKNYNPPGGCPCLN